MAQQTTGLCQNCHVMPVYVENGYAHNFCGRRCASAYKTGQQSPITSRGSPALSNPNMTCKLAGCRSPVFRSADGTLGQFCSKRHCREAVDTGKAEACMYCAQMPKALYNGKESDFCSRTCREETIRFAPIILEVGKKAFQNVVSQFNDGWKHSTPVPQVLKVWKIFEPKQTSDKFAQYKLAVERSRGLEGGNTRRRWHGTIRACKLGDDDNNRIMCNQTGCSLCNIVKSSFQILQAGVRTNFGRFGVGIYTSATSSKADGYVFDHQSRYKCMLLNTVVMGRIIKLTTNDESLTQPPPGYDAVVGEPGGDLAYDESIVYENDAIRPLYLVIYE